MRNESDTVRFHSGCRGIEPRRRYHYTLRKDLIKFDIPSGAFELDARSLPLIGVLTLRVIPPPSLPVLPIVASLECAFLPIDPSIGLPNSPEGLATLPDKLELVTVAARDLVLMKLGRKDDLGEAGLAAPSRGDPFGDRPVKVPVGRFIWVGLFEAVPGRDMPNDDRLELAAEALAEDELTCWFGPALAVRDCDLLLDVLEAETVCCWEDE